MGLGGVWLGVVLGWLYGPDAQVAYLLLVGEKANEEKYRQFQKEIKQHMIPGQQKAKAIISGSVYRCDSKDIPPRAGRLRARLVGR